MTDLRCRQCGRSNGAHTYAAIGVPHVPHDGDWSLCAYCSVWSVFEGGALRAPTSDEAAMIEASPECQFALKTLEEARAAIATGEKS